MNQIANSVDISGFGGAYEFTCQRMLWNGIEFVEAHPGIKEYKFVTYKNVTGLCGSSCDNARMLEAAIMAGVDDATGAMFHAVVGHVLYIANNGREKWLQEIAKDEPGRLFVFNGTVESCPANSEAERSAKEFRKGLNVGNDKGQTNNQNNAN